MTNNQKISGLLGLATKAGKIVFGTDACQIAIQKRKVKLLFIAIDASERTKKNFKEICNKYDVPIVEELKIEELSKYIGKENKAVVGVNDANFSKEIIKIVSGGEVIG